MPKARILLVDDNKFICTQLSKHLIGNGYFVQIASNGEEALEKALDNEFDMVILDIAMPGMDGFEVGKRLRDTIVTRDIIILILSAKSDAQTKLKADSELGAAGYVVKPFKLEELTQEIEKALLKKQQNS